MSAKKGDIVRVHYTGRLADGTVFDSSEGSDPLTFTLGEHEVIPGFEDSVEGMQVGEQKRELIPAALAYGDRREELLFEVERTAFPEHIDPEVGMPLEMQRSDGERLRVTVARMTEESVTLDANHPLAGEDLTFDIELVEIVG